MFPCIPNFKVFQSHISENEHLQQWQIGYLNGIRQKIYVRQVEQSLSSFFAQICFGIFEDFSKFPSTFTELFSTLRNHQICQHFGKNEEKPRSSCIKSKFWVVPNPSLICNKQVVGLFLHEKVCLTSFHLTWNLATISQLT